jgi:predicted DCC family thiol-disulfide oxidoreductase YuxK
VRTEIKENISGWVFYDADCAYCRDLAGRVHGLLASRRFHLAPLQASWVRNRLGLREGEPLGEMKMLTARGQIYGGADALIQLCRSIWWAWPIAILARIPGVKPIMRAAYRQAARNRYCLSGQCGLPRKTPNQSHRHSVTASFFELP